MPAVQRLHEMSLVERLWKYTALGATSIVFEEANPILGGIAARHGRAELFAVIAAVAIGTWIASLALYLVGRWRIDWVRARWPDKRRLLTGALTVVRRHPWRSALAIRFAYGLRLPLPIACGAARLPISLYVIASGISCWVWAGAFGYLGFTAGGAALAALHFAHRLDVRLGLVAVILSVVLFFMMRRRRIGERTMRVLGGEEVTIVDTAEHEASAK
ncbi:MAG: VTT domain-containing protein [Gemmatimonadota bacterium]|nr:VTT domain-containing protein [Gemmatimonadota bacterium]